MSRKRYSKAQRGETLAKVMESLVRYGELFGATEMVPISSKYNHLVTSFGLKALDRKSTRLNSSHAR